MPDPKSQSDARATPSSKLWLNVTPPKTGTLGKDATATRTAALKAMKSFPGHIPDDHWRSNKVREATDAFVKTGRGGKD